LTRLIKARSPIFWRNVASIVVCFLLLVCLALVALVIYLFCAISPVDPKTLPAETPDIVKWLLPVATGNWRVVLIFIGLMVIGVLAFVAMVGIKLLSADTLKAFGLEVNVSEERRQLEDDLAREVELNVALVENFGELQRVLERIASVFRRGDAGEFLELLDEIVELAGFIIRPTERTVRVSLWLLKKDEKKLRICSAYRVSLATRRGLVLEQAGKGFAAFVLREGAAQVLSSAALARHWVEDTTSHHQTTCILGQPVAIEDDGFSAVLCFSTDRELAKFPEYEFDVKRDAATLRLCEALLSTVLNIAMRVVVTETGKENSKLLDRIWARYAS